MSQTYDEIVMHVSYTRPSQDIGADEIRRWHVEGNGWSDIGYHFVIRRDGTVEEGRPLNRWGAHVGGHNTGKIGVCLVGGRKEDEDAPEMNLTRQQWSAAGKLVDRLRLRRPGVTMKVSGHHDHPGYESRWCPGFNVQAWLNED